MAKISAQVKKLVGEVKDKDGKVVTPGKLAAPVTVDYDLPEDLDGLVKKFGAEVIAANAAGAIVISLQSFLRRHIEKGTKHEDIQKEVHAWKPDVRTTVKQNAFEKASSSLDKLSPEERKALLAKLQASIGK